ncbi:MAG: DEAD/DEAH box helicase [Thermodesulfovibrio sp.]|nr:DEAD/DEAH box helicase [Thermodesulfovibrio sp.]
MEKPMAIANLINILKNDRQINAGITAHKYIPSKDAEFADINLNDRLRGVLRIKGIEKFYRHQAEGINLIRQGHNVVIMTPTASGKSLIYNIPVIESILQNPETKALYIFPLKGLEQDQVKNLSELLNDCASDVETFPSDSTITKKRRRGINAFAEVYDGDTTPHRRKKIREKLPNVIFTNPDMIHLALNQFHKKWEDFFRNLKYIVIDEVHTYRGVFGSNVSHVLRRLRRICNYWGSNPQFIACSATIANPKELTETLTGLPFYVVDKTGSPQSGKHFLCISPLDSAYSEATRIFLKCVNSGFRTIVFTKARKITELIYKWSIQRAPLLSEKISPYRAGFLPSERREIERKLFSGELTGVISTSALELGVDIGGLDVCILCGYPGSISSTWQRAGRVGRHGQESLIVMIAIKDALDHYLVSHPETFFGKPHEAVTCDPGNTNILKKHLVCAADELYLKNDDPVYDMPAINNIIDELVNEGSLKTGERGDIWFCRKRMPQKDVGIRSIGRPLKLKNEFTNKTIGDLDGRRIYRDAFPGAIYLHRGRQYEILKLDLLNNEAICREVDVQYYTQALSHERVEITGATFRTPSFNNRDIELYSGSLRITYQVTGYDRKHLFNGTRISRHAVEMPEYIFNTEGIYMIVHKNLANQIIDKRFDLAGTLHAAEHVTISSIPLFALCDKGDIGGLSYTVYPEFKIPAIFIYDGYEGGVGLAKRVLDVPYDWINSSIEIIRSCDCEEGCPSCVQDSQCGSANQPLDKKGALYFLNQLL